ncbi:hypothetical protein WJX81_006483 [Elliptochloris bilobata]|uniref:RNA-binding S4 domain-containing protein n=1 Tax=Elliptochloris bilobata TaxID=381761 RepID=A0AAW1SKF5_9CHLO
MGQPAASRGASGRAAAIGVGPAKAGRNASAKGGAPWERAPAPVRTVPPGERSKRQEKRARRGSESTERLAKVLARAGVASRRVAEEIIASGKVRVNGEVVLLPQRQVMQNVDKILVDGRPLLRNVARHYFAVNKPKGYLCASSAAPDTVGAKKLVIDLFADWTERVWSRANPRLPPPRLFTVGRLDVASTGLLFVTNDGHWAQRIQHPSVGVTKEYLVACTGPASRRQLETIAAGAVVEGAMVVPLAVAPVVDHPGDRSRLRVVVAEGRKHEVRELVAAAGLDVASLKRVRVGGYRLPRDLGVGQVRELKPHEVRRVLDLGAQNNNPEINPYFSALPPGPEYRMRIPV